MGTLSKLQGNAKPLAILGSIAALSALLLKFRAQRNSPAPPAAPVRSGRKGERVAVNPVFFKRIGSLLKIVLPGVLTAETGFMLLVSLSLVSRTTADLWVISTSTSIERAIIGRNKGEFIKYLFHFFCNPSHTHFDFF
jgi:ATP-binding cassette, subfamily D (ALD), member 3